jgi:hypothetical protein
MATTDTIMVTMVIITVADHLAAGMDTIVFIITIHGITDSDMADSMVTIIGILRGMADSDIIALGTGEVITTHGMVDTITVITLVIAGTMAVAVAVMPAINPSPVRAKGLAIPHLQTMVEETL